MSRIEHLAEGVTTLRHKWDYDKTKRIPAAESLDGNERTERLCERCGLVKITVHPPQGFPWIEWRHRNRSSIQLSNTPPCVGGEQ